MRSVTVLEVSLTFANQQGRIHTPNDVKKHGMKRSEINSYIRWAERFLADSNIRLPDLAYWSPAELASRRDQLSTVRRLELGWDITDFGSGDFLRVGAVLYTVRNGLAGDPGVGVPYCEKYILMREGQFLPMHYHVFKSEDIINRAGGDVAVRLWNVDRATGKIVDGDVVVMMDGIRHVFASGEEIIVFNGCSVTLLPYMAHVFGPKVGTGDVVIGEVSKVNDDHTDNYFLEPVARFADIEEDEAPCRVLCNEYGNVLGDFNNKEG